MNGEHALAECRIGADKSSPSLVFFCLCFLFMANGQHDKQLRHSPTLGRIRTAAGRGGPVGLNSLNIDAPVYTGRASIVSIITG
jgi:hypothetical protein